MQFGIFDHLDDSGIAPGEQLEQRLQLVQQYNRDGFYAYHLAEHHGTPLGIVGSPNLFLAAVAQRTRQIHFGARVNVLPLYHPLRLVEEWCLLDQLSGGRLQPGIGRGASPIEASFYGVDGDSTPARFDEAFDLITRAFAAGESFSYTGTHFQVAEMPVTARPLQRPHPPFWFGASRPDRAGWCAERAINVMSLVSAQRTRETTDGFRQRWQELGHGESELPHLGVNRHIVLADSEHEALRVAERVYPRFKDSIDHLWIRRGMPRPPIYPETVGELIARGSAYVGTPDGARQYISEQIDVAGINYMTMDVAFGGITFEEASRTTALFTRDVMPAFATTGSEVPR
ncbi:MAG TPA: LLM class flavin-dependent oxidoreductase [Solirubrobacteraceae bacterium]|nr:LLM class flavin-dependent oxidoreductase [Solirubrobacteraceae bacterium]